MEVERINLQKYAMRYGTYMGIFWAAKFCLFPPGVANPLLMMVFVVLTLTVPFVSYFMVRSFRDTYCEGAVTFAQGWIFTSFLYTFAALFVAVAHYVYFAYIDQGYLVNTYSSLIQETRALKIPETEQMLTQMEQVLETIRELSPIEMVIQLLAQNIIYGSILAIPVAFFVKRKKSFLP